MFESIPTAAIAIPYNPASENANNIEAAKIIIGRAVEIIPVLRPEIIFVADPVSDCLAIFLTGRLPKPVKYSVIRPISTPATNPITVARKILLAVIV